MSPVHLAAMEGHTNCLTILLHFNAYANYMDFSEERYICLTFKVTALSIYYNAVYVWHHIPYTLSFSNLAHRYTPLDYAKLYSQNACVDILTNSGGVTAHAVKEMAAISIQALYRGHRYQVI